MDELNSARSLSPNTVVRQLEELVEILRKQITMLEAKNISLSEQNELLMLREQTCVCFSQQNPVVLNEPVSIEDGQIEEPMDSEICTQGITDNFCNDETDVDCETNYVTDVQNMEGVGGIESDPTNLVSDEQPMTLSLGTIQILPNADVGGAQTSWSTGQRIEWPLSINEHTKYEIVLVSQGPIPETRETVVSLDLENGANNFTTTDPTPEPPRERPPGQRGKLAAKITCECPVCGKGLSGKRSLRQHMPIHTGQKNHTCDICKMSFITKSNLTRHSRKHTGEKPFECIYCGRTFAHLGDVHMHHRTHTGERPFSCTLCDNAFVTSAHLRRHMRSHARKPDGWQGNDRGGTGEDNTHLCQLCGKVFGKKQLLKRHLLTHEKKNERESNKNKIKDIDDLTDGGDHTSTTDFHCPSCPKKFPSKLRLTRHKLIHTKIKIKEKKKLFKCPKCNRSFQKELNLEKHLIDHAERLRMRTRKSKKPRTFTCGHCYRDFKTRFQVNRHMRKHTSSEEYKCDICLEKFSRKLAYLNHMRVVHGNNHEYNDDEIEQELTNVINENDIVLTTEEQQKTNKNVSEFDYEENDLLKIDKDDEDDKSNPIEDEMDVSFHSVHEINNTLFITDNGVYTTDKIELTDNAGENDGTDEYKSNGVYEIKFKEDDGYEHLDNTEDNNKNNKKELVALALKGCEVRLNRLEPQNDL